jgi:hypothetical protein
VSRPVRSGPAAENVVRGEQVARIVVSQSRPLGVLVRAAGGQLPFLDAEVPREFGIVSHDRLDEALGVRAPNERLDGFAEWGCRR